MNSAQPDRPPSLIVEDKAGTKLGVTIAQQDPTWRPPETAADRGLSPDQLLRLRPVNKNDPAPDVPDYPLRVANPFEMIGRNADILLPGTSPLPARVTTFHGAFDLSFSGRRVRVRDLLELELATVSPEYFQLFLEKHPPTLGEAGPFLAGRLVCTTAPVAQDGEKDSHLIGLVIGGAGRRLVVVPIHGLLLDAKYVAVPPTIARPEPMPIELTVRSGIDSNLSSIIGLQRLRAVNVERLVRDRFLNTSQRVGFYDDEADVCGALAQRQTTKAGA